MAKKQDIDLSKIKNPIIKRAFQLRRGDFMFNYGDEGSYNDSSHTDKSNREYNDAWKKYKDHTDHTESPKYNDSGWYTDFCSREYSEVKRFNG